MRDFNEIEIFTSQSDQNVSFVLKSPTENEKKIEWKNIKKKYREIDRKRNDNL